MKRYLCFAFERYYPSGGLNDLFHEDDEYEKAVKKCLTSEWEETQILDRQLGKVYYPYKGVVESNDN